MATLLLVQREGSQIIGRTYLRGVDSAKFRRQVVPGDQLRLDVTLGRRRAALARVHCVAYVRDDLVAEAELLMAVLDDAIAIDPTAQVHPKAAIGAGTIIGPHVVIGEHVSIGRRCRIGASTVIDGWTEIGDDNDIFPFSSLGLVPQDLKFKGEATRLRIGSHNVFREFVTVLFHNTASCTGLILRRPRGKR